MTAILSLLLVVALSILVTRIAERERLQAPDQTTQQAT